ncbi:hypothetical protein K1X13_14085 [Nocardioides sp. WL0053]|uniref:Methyl-accepting chemotaxis protein n=1 Tax=Nocardioides jiangsuensis TaxID=2866161 RepID=A0ABS7RLM4_9ACTN|nr:hypothetical protein [Nocardioides jiangsuensis]MBY9075959.1 hypothetical protein [Nocardioides jiangsuensis]
MDPASDCAARLAALSADPRFASRSEDLRSLAEDVGTDDMDAPKSWGGIDLFAAFPKESTVTVGHRDGLEHLLGVLAGITVFMPVAWTWLSFHRASQAYNNLLQTGSEEGRTFLSLWTTGFDGRLQDRHLLVPMSLVSVGLIIFAVLFIVAHRLAASYNVRREDARLSEAQAELASCLTDAQRVLNSRRAENHQQIGAMVKESVRRLLRAHDATEAGAQELRETMVEVRDALTPVLSSLQATSAESASSAERAKQASEALIAAVDQTESGLKRIMGDLGDSLGARVEHFATSLSAHTDKFASSVGTHVAELRRETQGALHTAGTAARAAADEVVSSVTSVAEVQRGVVDEIARLSATSTNFSADVKTLIAALQETVREVDASLVRHESAMQAQVSELTSARDAAERMLLQLEQQASTNGHARTF